MQHLINTLYFYIAHEQGNLNNNNKKKKAHEQEACMGCVAPTPYLFIVCKHLVQPCHNKSANLPYNNSCIRWNIKRESITS